MKKILKNMVSIFAAVSVIVGVNIGFAAKEGGTGSNG